MASAPISLIADINEITAFTDIFIVSSYEVSYAGSARVSSTNFTFNTLISYTNSSAIISVISAKSYESDVSYNVNTEVFTVPDGTTSLVSVSIT